MTFLRAAAVLLISAWSSGYVSNLTAQEADYEQHIRPLLDEKCIACHGPVRQEAGLRLDHGELIRRGGDSGSAIEFAKNEPGQSLLLRRVSDPDPSSRMPPEDEGLALTGDQMRLLTTWVEAGATTPEDEPLPVTPDEHWAWQVPERSRPPLVRSTTFDNADHHDSLGTSLLPENPIDAFILAKLDERGLTPLTSADPRTRLRRLYLDLIGLPPLPETQREFVSDPSPEAWDCIVDRLLNEAAYGERWARHWMDVWRYSDWDGYKDQVRGSQRHIWRWRDWIIESLNADKGYDRMIVEMLAGDEVAPKDYDTLRATGFLARNYHHSNRNIWLDATVEHTAKAFLSMTLNCARCHDHKYDPISQREYYEFRAIFEPHQVRMERLPGVSDLAKQGLPRVYDAELDAPTYLFVAGNEKLPDEENPLDPATPALVNVPFDVTAVELPPVAAFPALRDFVQREERAAAKLQVSNARSALEALSEEPHQAEEAEEVALAVQQVRKAEASLDALKARWVADGYRYGVDEADRCADRLQALRQAAAEAERQSKIEAAKWVHLSKKTTLRAAELALAEITSEKSDSKAIEAKQAEFEKARKEFEAAKKGLEKAERDSEEELSYTPVGKVFPRESSGRRTALARWITDRRNPLTARVAINYIWMHHFGEPLVENVFDFGLRSGKPTHYALLDWLAVELMDGDWSMKHIHRLIVTSQAYQRASSVPGSVFLENMQRDPDNEFLWRANTRRMDAEVVRDSLLYVAGNLDQTTGGPDINFRDGEKVRRRSIYFRHAYEKQMTMLVTFDAAGPNECYRRTESILPQQALALANSPLTIDQSRLLAAKLITSCTSETQLTASEVDRIFIREAFELLLSRECSSSEAQLCLDFLERQAKLLSRPEALTRLPGKDEGETEPSPEPKQRARENLLHALMNHNDFVTVR